MGSNFDIDTFAVFLPNDPEGMPDGSYHLATVVALDKNDAIVKAAHEWYGRNSVQEGTYIVCRANALTAYEVEQEKSVAVRAQVSLPKAPA